MKRECDLKEYGFLAILPSEDEQTREALLHLAYEQAVFAYANGSEDSLTLKSKSREAIQRLREEIKSHNLDVVIKKLP